MCASFCSPYKAPLMVICSFPVTSVGDQPIVYVDTLADINSEQAMQLVVELTPGVSIANL